MRRLWRADEAANAILPGNVLIPPVAARATQPASRARGTRGVSRKRFCEARRRSRGGRHRVYARGMNTLRARTCEQSALANSLNLNLQFHFLLEPKLVTEADAEVAAIEGRRRISAAHFLL
jgi:hypothetical protein